MFLKLLRSLGFSEKEANLYMTLLQLGSQATSILARKAGLNRSTAYELLKNLAKRGFVIRYSRHRIEYFSPAPPESFLAFVEQKKKMIRMQEHQIRSFLPEFHKVATGSVLFPPRVSFFEGRDGLTHILDEVLKSRRSALCFLNLDEWITGFLQNFRPSLDILFRSSVRCFIADSLFARDYVSRFDFPFCFMDDPGCQFFIFDHKIAIVASQFGFIIENKEITQFHRIIFDILWKLCAEKPDQ